MCNGLYTCIILQLVHFLLWNNFCVEYFFLWKKSLLPTKSFLGKDLISKFGLLLSLWVYPSD